MKRMLAFCMALVLCLSLLPTGALAEEKSGTCGDGLTWTLSDSGVLTISGKGAMDDYQDQTSSGTYLSGPKGEGAPWFGDADEIVSVVIGEGVTSIGSYAFNACYYLKNVSIPDSVTKIGVYAFWGCEKIKSVTIPESVTVIGGGAFASCDGLTSVTIPSGVTEISDSVFANCDSLTSVTIPSGVTKIGSSAFSSCHLTSIELPSGLREIGGSAFEYSGLTSVTIPSSVTEIGDYAFRNCRSLTSVVFEDGLTVLGSHMFYDCDGITSVTIPGSVSHISIDAFNSCGGLKTVVLEEGVKSIGDYAFTWCGGGTYEEAIDITLPLSLTEIGERAFYCTHVDDVNYGGTLEDWKEVEIKDEGAWFKSYDLHCKPISLKKAVVEVDNQNYTGEALTPEPIVTLDGTELTEGKDYTVKYAKNTAAGVATVRVTGIGKYDGSAKGTFKILTEKPVIKSIKNVSSGVKLTWDKVAGAKGYEISRKAGGAWEILGVSKKASFTDTNVQSGVKYAYRVRCVTKDGSTSVSGYSKTKSIKYLAAPTLTEAKNASKGVKLTWGGVDGASKYAVYRKVKGGSWEFLAATKKTTYTDKTAESGVKYYYKVCCAAKDGQTPASAYSASQSVKRK